MNTHSLVVYFMEARQKGAVLFVDDNEHILEAVCLASSFFGNMELHVANSVSKAMELLKKIPIDVIVSDLNMPEMNGREFFEMVRADHPRIFRIMQSATMDRGERMQAEACADLFLEKPCDFAQLAGAIRKVLGKM